MKKVQVQKTIEGLTVQLNIANKNFNKTGIIGGTGSGSAGGVLTGGAGEDRTNITTRPTTSTPPPTGVTSMQIFVK
jgi:hypothetical protein